MSSVAGGIGAGGLAHRISIPRSRRTSAGAAVTTTGSRIRWHELLKIVSLVVLYALQERGLKE